MIVRDLEIIGLWILLILQRNNLCAAFNTSQTSSIHLNKTVTDTNSASFERGVSSIILMEIQGNKYDKGN